MHRAVAAVEAHGSHRRRACLRGIALLERGREKRGGDEARGTIRGILSGFPSGRNLGIGSTGVVALQAEVGIFTPITVVWQVVAVQYGILVPSAHYLLFARFGCIAYSASLDARSCHTTASPCQQYHAVDPVPGGG
jgi:hypothetical protein